MAIYLIGGPPKCGKTTVAKTMSRQTQIPWISADTLQNIVWAYTSQPEHATRFPHSYLPGDDNAKLYEQHTPEQIVENYIAQGKTVYDALSMMVETYLTDEDDFIVEGYQVAPEIIDRIFKRFGRDHVRAAFLVKHDEKRFVDDLPKSTTPNDWILRSTKSEETHRRIAAMVAEYSCYFEREVKKYGFPLFLMDEDFDDKVNEIIRYLTAK